MQGYCTRTEMSLYTYSDYAYSNRDTPIVVCKRCIHVLGLGTAHTCCTPSSSSTGTADDTSLAVNKRMYGYFVERAIS